MRKIILFLIVICLTCSVPGCAARSRVLVKAEAVEAIAQGRTLTVIDRQAGNNYEFRVVRVRRSDAVVEPVKMISTPTLTIRQGRHSVTIIAGTEVYIIPIIRGGWGNAKSI